jgi:hypothetical protein
MPKIEADELEVLNAFEKGELKSIATKSELARFRAAARATAMALEEDKPHREHQGGDETL